MTSRRSVRPLVVTVAAALCLWACSSSVTPSGPASAPADPTAGEGGIDAGTLDAQGEGGGDSAPPLSDEARCLAGGGTVSSATCCSESSDFPESCEVGACSCDPSKGASKKTCQCPADQCWSQASRACVASKTAHPAMFDASHCRAFCGMPRSVGCGRLVGPAMQTGTGMISEETSGCFVDATIETYQARFRYDCVKGLVCLVAADGSETCETATGDGNNMYFKTASEQVLCLP